MSRIVWVIEYRREGSRHSSYRYAHSTLERDRSLKVLEGRPGVQVLRVEEVERRKEER